MDALVENYCNSHVILCRKKIDQDTKKLYALNAYMGNSIID